MTGFEASQGKALPVPLLFGENGKLNENCLGTLNLHRAPETGESLTWLRCGSCMTVGCHRTRSLTVRRQSVSHSFIRAALVNCLLARDDDSSFV